MLIALILTLAFATTFIGVALFRRWSLKRGIVDIPNDRSSHSTPTPRGGGIVIAAVTVIAYVAGSAIFHFPLSYGYLIGVLLIVIISSLDDLYSVPVLWRFLVHGIAAGALIYENGYFTAVYVPYYAQNIDLGAIGVALSFIWIVWLINSYNFMDGIDGIAGIQAVVAGLGWTVVALLADIPAVILISGAVMSSSAAFLLHNWQPARIFMGDAGSAFLGYTFASIPLIFLHQLKNESGLVPLIAVLFVWLFVFDSIFTLFKRMLNGEKVWQAHRQHIYQKLVISGLSHQQVSLLFGLLAFVIMVPSVSVLSGSVRLEFLAIPIVIIATISLLVIYHRRSRISEPG